ncbi:MAG: hypothetical protein ACT4QA_01055 [Panacagrimonas sp.]
MNKRMNLPLQTLLLAVALMLGALAPLAEVQAQATEPGALFQHGTIYGIGNQIYAYRVPVRLANGRIAYQDFVIDIAKNANGRLLPRASVVIEPSPRVDTRAAVPGRYRTVQGGTCVVDNFVLANARTQTRLQCVTDSDDADEPGKPLTINVATGVIGPGHPYEANLKDAEIDQRPDVDNFFWGLVTLPTNSQFDTLGGCRNFDVLRYPVGLQQVGSTIMLSVFGTSGDFACSVSLEPASP